MQASSRIRRELFPAENAEKQQKVLTTEDTGVTEEAPKPLNRKGPKGIRKVRQDNFVRKVQRIRRELFPAENAEKQQKVLTTEDTGVTEEAPKPLNRKGREGIRKDREGSFAGGV